MAKVALLVGVSEYQPGLNPLPAAIKDVEALKQILQNPDTGGFVETDITVLKNPRRDDVAEAIESLFSNRKKDDLVLFFFSGHGIKDDTGKLYLAACNTHKNERGELFRSSAVAASFIHETMSRSRSKRQVVILDSCFSGAFAEGLSARDDGTVNIREELGGEGRAILTSSSSTQYSFEEEKSDLSVYTKCLVEGISTGKADLDGDEVVSINDLHKYVSERIQEIQPAMKPEIYAIREGFDIRIAKIPPVEPPIKYRKTVEKYGKRGELTIVSRGILDSLRRSLKLSPEEAETIETEVLEPYREAFKQKLQQYEKVVTELLKKHQTISESHRQELRDLQQVLELRNEDTVPIEAKVTAKLKAYQENLKRYEQTYRETLRQTYPLTEVKRQELQKIIQEMELTESDVIAIETSINTEIETYYHHLKEYRQLFSKTVRQEYPLSEAKRDELKAEQNRLRLTEIDVAAIEAEITNEIETYQQKLQQYEKAFLDATKGRYYPTETTRQQLQQTWQKLELSEVDVTTIEAKIKKQINKYQSNLKQYEQEFSDAIKEQYTLSEVQKQQLQQRQQSLGLMEEDINPIETRLKTEIEEYLQKLDQYKQVFISLIEYEYPIKNESRQELVDLQTILGLTDEQVTTLEKEIIAKRNGVVKPDEDVDSRETQHEEVKEKDKPIITSDNNPIPDSDKNLGTIEDETKIQQPINQKNEQPLSNLEGDKHQEKLEEYKQLFSYLISEQNYRKDPDYIAQTLKKLKENLGLNNVDVVGVETQVLEQRKTVKSQTLKNLSINKETQKQVSSIKKEKSHKKFKISPLKSRILLLVGLPGILGLIFIGINYQYNNYQYNNLISLLNQDEWQKASDILDNSSIQWSCIDLGNIKVLLDKYLQTHQNRTFDKYLEIKERREYIEKKMSQKLC